MTKPLSSELIFWRRETKTQVSAHCQGLVRARREKAEDGGEQRRGGRTEGCSLTKGAGERPARAALTSLGGPGEAAGPAGRGSGGAAGSGEALQSKRALWAQGGQGRCRGGWTGWGAGCWEMRLRRLAPNNQQTETSVLQLGARLSLATSTAPRQTTARGFVDNMCA